MEEFDEFEAGFNKGLGVTDTIEYPEVDEPAEQVEENTEPEAEESTIEPEQEVVQEVDHLAEIRDRIAAFEAYKESLERVKGFDPEQYNSRTEKVFGKLGQLEQELKQLKTEPTRPELTAESFKNLHADYDDIAAALAKDMQELLLERKVVEQVDMQALQSALNEAVAHQTENIRREFEEKAFERDMKALNRLHPDKDAIVQSEDWSKWISSKGDSFAKELSENDTDLHYVSSILQDYKAEKAAAEQQAEAEKAKAIEQKKEDKKARLEDAVMPKTSAPSTQKQPLSDDEIFEQARINSLKKMGKLT